ncbi:MAG: hypothetical protein NTW81_02545 [Actinobacteria bacterium]|nr:hypothetical protein [Actinomycetota bacterium]
MSDQTNDESIAEVQTESVNSNTSVEPTLRARISTWLSKRALSSVIVASVLALLVGIGVGHASTMHHERDRFGMHQFGPGSDHDGRGPGMMGPGSGQFGPGNGQGGPGMMGPDDRGPGNGLGQDGQIPPLPSASPASK